MTQLKIFVRTYEGRSCIVDVSNEETVVSVKKKIASDRCLGTPVEKQRLSHRGLILEDYAPISKYNLSQGSYLRLEITPTDESGSSERPQSHLIAANVSERRKQLEEQLTASLRKHFDAGAVTKIVSNLFREIGADVSHCSLDDLERLSGSKLSSKNN